MTRKADKQISQPIKPEQFNYCVAWSEEDEIFIGRVTEFPSLAAHGGTQEKVLREIRTVVRFVLEDLGEEGAAIPVPLGKRNFSGS